MKQFKYKVIKNAIDSTLAEFCSNYLRLKKECYFTLNKTNNLVPYANTMGVYPDTQCKNAYATYGDIAMETLLVMLKPTVEHYLEIKLIPTYAYARVYDNGSELFRHKDRMSCDFSTTLNLGGDEWPIYVEPNENIGKDTDKGYIPGNTKGKKIKLSPGDMLIYRGCLIEHWREKFTGNYCSQVFLHYNDAEKKENLFDGRVHLGLPGFMKTN